MRPDTKTKNGLRLLPLLILAWLALQVAVPAYALSQQRPTRLGWQMYTTTTELPAVQVEMLDGSRHDIDVASMVARGRSETDYVPAVIATLCGEPNAKAVFIDGREQPCR